MNKSGTTEKSRFVVQRWCHASFGTHTSHWHPFSHERFVSQDLARTFREKPTDENVATKVLAAVSKARPYEKFRLVLETVVTTEKPLLEMKERVVLGPNDIERFLDGAKVEEKGRESKTAMAHDGFRDFNGIVPAMVEIRLNPHHFGAYRESVVREALRQWKAGHFEDKWIPLYPEAKEDAYNGTEAHKKKMTATNRACLINFAQRIEIRAENYGFGRDRIQYIRYSYGNPERYPEESRFWSLAEAKAGKKSRKQAKAA